MSPLLSVGNGIVARRVARLPYLPPLSVAQLHLYIRPVSLYFISLLYPPRSCSRAPNTLPCDSPLRATSSFTLSLFFVLFLAGIPHRTGGECVGSAARLKSESRRHTHRRCACLCEVARVGGAASLSAASATWVCASASGCRAVGVGSGLPSRCIWESSVWCRRAPYNRGSTSGCVESETCAGGIAAAAHDGARAMVRARGRMRQCVPYCGAAASAVGEGVQTVYLPSPSGGRLEWRLG
jgi:hypothetical protein